MKVRPNTDAMRAVFLTPNYMLIHATIKIFCSGILLFKSLHLIVLTDLFEWASFKPTIWMTFSAYRTGFANSSIN